MRDMGEDSECAGHAQENCSRPELARTRKSQRRSPLGRREAGQHATRVRGRSDCHARHCPAIRRPARPARHQRAPELSVLPHPRFNLALRPNWHAQKKDLVPGRATSGASPAHDCRRRRPTPAAARAAPALQRTVPTLARLGTSVGQTAGRTRALAAQRRLTTLIAAEKLLRSVRGSERRLGRPCRRIGRCQA